MKRKKLLSFILALVMVFSLLPMSAFAAGAGADVNGFGLGGGIKPRPMDQYPAQTLTSEAVDGLTVTVDAPKGALPVDVEMNVTKVEDLSAVQAAVDALDDVNGTALVAADITFVSNGKEIQPKKEVTVTMASDALPADSALTVVHLDAGVGELDDADVTAEPVAVTAAEANAVSFDADKFSVYAVLGPDETGDEARVAVNFYGADGNIVATYYVKNSDVILGDGERQDDVSYIEDIVTDPGVGGTLPSGQIFLGWTIDAADANTNGEDENYDPEHYGADYSINTKPYTIDGVCQYLADLDIKEGDTLDIFPLIFKVYSVTYLDEQGISLGSDDVYLKIDETKYVGYTVSKNYTPVSSTQHFEGWLTEDDAKISNAKYADADAAEPYKMGTTMDITGSVTFRVDAPEGRWLTFNENGKGATYNAPQFVRSGATTSQPTLATKPNMIRPGYEFVD